MLHIVSAGMGVQTVTILRMAQWGIVTPMPDCAIFADTGAEPQPVYDTARLLCWPNMLPFPVYTVRAVSDLRSAIIAAAEGRARRVDARPPFYLRNPDGSRGRLRRQCTRDYKLEPIERKIRELLGLRFRQRWPKHPVVTQWIGISTDEAQRMRTPDRPAIINRYPLIELNMSRDDCVRWLESHGYPVPAKSACTFCPFRRNASWRWLKEADPRGFATAVEVDRAIRRRGFVGLVGEAYVHDSLVPLEEADLSPTRAELAAIEKRKQLPIEFGEECAGVCGV